MAVAQQMSSKVFNGIKYVLLTIFAVFNIIMAWNIFTKYAENEFLQIVYGGLGIAWDLFMLIILMSIKTAAKFRKFAQLIGYVLVYAVLVVIGVVGSIGFSVAGAKNQAVNTEIRNTGTLTILDNIKSAKLEVSTYEQNIIAYQDSLKTVGADRIQRKTEVMDLIAGESEKLKIATANLNLLNEQLKSSGEIEVSSTDIFTSVGDSIGIDGERVRSIVFIAICLMIQFGLFVNAPTIQTKIKIKGVNKTSVIKYIDALFDVTGRRLNNDEKIKEKTGLEDKECKEVWNFLSNLEPYNGLKMVSTAKGGRKASVPKETLKSVVIVRMNSGSE